MEVIKLLLQKDLDSLIAQADAEHWLQLALIGPDSRVLFVEDLPEPLRTSDHVFQLATFDEELTKKLSSLTKLTSLILWNNRIGTEGAQALAALANLSLLDLGENGIGHQLRILFLITGNADGFAASGPWGTCCALLRNTG